MKEFFNIIKSLTLFFLFIVVLVIIGLIYRSYEKVYPSTEDASLEADIIPVSTNISERVNTVLVKNNSLVNENQILFTLDNTQETLAYQKALSAWKQARDIYQRYLKIVNVGIPETTLENAQTALQVSQANLANAKYNLDNTVVRASRDGLMLNFHLQKGEYLTPNTIVGGLVIKHSAWVQANILEPFLENIRVGQRATFEFRMYPGKQFVGVVEEVGYGIQTTPPSNSPLPYVDPQFNWVFLSKRFPVRIRVLSEDPFTTTPFRVGATVNIRIDTKKYV